MAKRMNNTEERKKQLEPDGLRRKSIPSETAKTHATVGESGNFGLREYTKFPLSGIQSSLFFVQKFPFSHDPCETLS